MKAPDPNCSNCEGKGWVPAVSLDIHGDGKHACFCVMEDEAPLAEWTKEQLIEELEDWRAGRTYRGYDRIQALKVPGLEARVQELEARALPASALQPGALTREQIEACREVFRRQVVWELLPNSVKCGVDALCDMALSSLSASQDAIHAARLEGAEAATKRALQAVEDEPNLPGPMPDGFQKTFEQLPLDEALRIIVALTKSGIRERIVEALEQKEEI